MGILTSTIHLLAKERHSYPIRGRVLTLGQQAVFTDLPTVQRILQFHNCPSCPLPPGLDTGTKIAGWQRSPALRGRTNAQALFALLGADSVQVLDISDYEGADIVWDLSEPIRPHHRGMFDVIFDGGTLEHVFDISTALANLTEMLAPGGALILTNPSSNAIDHGFYSISPTLYYDYFGANGFGEFSCYIVEGPWFSLPERPGKVYKYAGVGAPDRFASGVPVGLMFFARKQTAIDESCKPVQTFYRNQGPPVVQARSRAASSIMSVIRFLKLRRLLLMPYCPDCLVDSIMDRWHRRSRQGIHFVGRW